MTLPPSAARHAGEIRLDLAVSRRQNQREERGAWLQLTSLPLSRLSVAQVVRSVCSSFATLAFALARSASMLWLRCLSARARPETSIEQRWVCEHNVPVVAPEQDKVEEQRA